MSAKSSVAVPNSGGRRLIIGLAVLMSVCVASLIIAGATSLISLADRIHPLAGTIVFWVVCVAAGFLALYCTIAYARLPAALVPPEEDVGPQYRDFFRGSSDPTRCKPPDTEYAGGNP